VFGIWCQVFDILHIMEQTQDIFFFSKLIEETYGVIKKLFFKILNFINTNYYYPGLVSPFHIVFSCA